MADDAPPDADLTRQAQAGARQAFDALVRRHKGPLYRFVRRSIGTDDDAYDIVQDSFVSAWMALRRYDARRPFPVWLRAIALNKCRDFGRRQAVRRRFRRILALDREAQETQPDLHGEEGREAERLRRLDKAIAELPAFYKEPLLLIMVSGLSQEETAKQLDTTTKAIEMRIRRAKKKLLAALSDLKGEG